MWVRHTLPECKAKPASSSNAGRTDQRSLERAAAQVLIDGFADEEDWEEAEDEEQT